MNKMKGKIIMGIYEELVARGLIAQVTNEPEIKEMVNNGKATSYRRRYYNDRRPLGSNRYEKDAHSRGH